MSRPKGLTRRISKNISLPEDIVARMELELYSEVDGRIPIGAQSQLIEKLLREHFAVRDLPTPPKYELLDTPPFPGAE